MLVLARQAQTKKKSAKKIQKLRTNNCLVTLYFSRTVAEYFAFN